MNTPLWTSARKADCGWCASSHPRRKLGRSVRSGMTLVEVMLAMVVLAIVILGGAAYMVNSSRDIAYQRHKRAAIETASRRLERVRSDALNWADQVEPNTSYYLSWKKTNDGFALSNSNPDEKVAVNDIPREIETRVRLADISPGSGNTYVGAKCLEIEVRLSILGGSDVVELRSYYSN